MGRLEESLILFVVLVFVLSAVEAKSINQRNRHSRRQQQQDNIQQYYWMCPDVVCPPLPRGCQQVEYFVFQYDYAVSNGRVVNVRCESCEYCLDLPDFLQGSGSSSGVSALTPEESAQHRRRRSLTESLRPRAATADATHHQITCPDLPPACADVRMTDVLIANRSYGRCPACYDSTVVKNL